MRTLVPVESIPKRVCPVSRISIGTFERVTEKRMGSPIVHLRQRAGRRWGFLHVRCPGCVGFPCIASFFHLGFMPVGDMDHENG